MTCLATTAFSAPPAYVEVEHGSQACLESFSRLAPDPSWDRWQDWLEHLQLDPAVVEDELTAAPSRRGLALAAQLLHELKSCFPAYPPASVVIGPNGEIIIERREQDLAAQFVVHDDGQVEQNVYQEGRLIGSTTLSGDGVAGA